MEYVVLLYNGLKVIFLVDNNLYNITVRATSRQKLRWKRTHAFLQEHWAQDSINNA